VFFLIKRIPSAPLFLRKLVLGIPAQASGKNHVAINASGVFQSKVMVGLPVVSPTYSVQYRRYISRLNSCEDPS